MVNISHNIVCIVVGNVCCLYQYQNHNNKNIIVRRIINKHKSEAITLITDYDTMTCYTVSKYYYIFYIVHKGLM